MKLSLIGHSIIGEILVIPKIRVEHSSIIFEEIFVDNSLFVFG